MKRALLLTLLVAACGPPPQRHYYTLTPSPPTTRFQQPFSIKLRVRELELKRSYRREELVSRSDANELTYARARRWSEPPQRMITAMLREQARGSNIAAEIQDENAISEPDYVWGGEIEAIEELDTGAERFAHVAITYRLLRVKDDATVWTYRIDARRPVSGASARSMVRQMSEIIAQETDRALADLGHYLADPNAPRVAAQAAPAPAAEAPADTGVVKPDTASPLNNLPQLMRDDTPLPVGFGAIFAPMLSAGVREPPVGVYKDGSQVASGQTGHRITVEPGEYEVRVGSGVVSQQVATKVRVAEGKTTVVPPTWAALDVEVVDDTFIPFRGTYELIRMNNREGFGLGFGADEQLGETTRVWLLPGGLYKIIRAGGTYRDRTNFATVRLEPGRLTRFTLVLDRNDGSFHGAGENDPDLTDLVLTAAEESESPWQLRAILGGDLNFNKSEIVGTQPGWKLSFRAFFDGQLRYAAGPHLWLTRLEIEEGETRVLDKRTFQNDTDRFFFHTIYTYQLLPWFGPYARLGVETKLLPRHQDLDPPRDVQKLDADGNVVSTQSAATRVELGAFLAPLQLKEGAGGNFRVLRTTALELDLRLGFGARQTLANNLYLYKDVMTGLGQLVPVEDSNLTGVETTLVGLGRLSSFMVLSTEFDGLLPVTGDPVLFTWRNQLTLRLASFLSLNYRFNVVRDPSLGTNDVLTEHDVQLRFSYVLF
jgi:ABC-type uncharacterized transport system auxiliary subunit